MIKPIDLQLKSSPNTVNGYGFYGLQYTASSAIFYKNFYKKVRYGGRALTCCIVTGKITSINAM